MALYISSDRDLRNWVDGAVEQATDRELDWMRDQIQAMPGRPEWGDDWESFLANLDMEKLIMAELGKRGAFN